jgi:hypothetical protein
MRWRTFGGTEPEGRFSACDGDATRHAFDPGRTWFACMGPDAVTVTDLASGERRRIPLDLEEAVAAIAIAPGGAWIALGLAGGDVVLVPTDEG